MYNKAFIKTDCWAPVNKRVEEILDYKNLYVAASAATQVPWDVIACIHSLESDLSLTRHLHNGDPIFNRTVNAPAGRPLKGKPPFTWTDSCIDALSMIPKPDLWNLDWKLYFLESYNGFGYRKQGINSPYLWSMTNLYEKGKYVADGCYDPDYISQQIGAVALLKNLLI